MKPEINSENKAASDGCVSRLVRLSDRVGSLIHGFDAPEHRDSVRQLRREVRAMEIQLEAARNRHCFCPDCRDKVREEECLRCQVQKLTRKLRKYEPNDEVDNAGCNPTAGAEFLEALKALESAASKGEKGLQGFANNNCIGYVKARDNISYWKRVRKHYPEVFKRRAAQERKFSVAINRITRNGVRSEIYLDEIEEGDPKGEDFAVTCGLFCMSEADQFSPQNA